jgi:hypothetical protein
MEVGFKFMYVNVYIKTASTFYVKYDVHRGAVYTNHKFCYIFMKLEIMLEK